MITTFVTTTIFGNVSGSKGLDDLTTVEWIFLIWFLVIIGLVIAAYTILLIGLLIDCLIQKCKKFKCTKINNCCSYIRSFECTKINNCCIYIINFECTKINNCCNSKCCVYNIRNNKVSDNVCSICLEKISNDIYTLDCNHSFHKECITKWMNQCEENTNKKIFSCPLCRNEVDIV